MYKGPVAIPPLTSLFIPSSRRAKDQTLYYLVFRVPVICDLPSQHRTEVVRHGVGETLAISKHR
jgi:hypothetical protein